MWSWYREQGPCQLGGLAPAGGPWGPGWGDLVQRQRLAQQLYQALETLRSRWLQFSHPSHQLSHVGSPDHPVNRQEAGQEQPGP